MRRTTELEAFEADDLDLVAGVSGSPSVSRACHSSPFTETSPSRPTWPCVPTIVCGPDRGRAPPGLDDLGEHEGEERRERERDRERHAQRDLVAGAGRLEQQQRSEDEARGARQCERAVAEDDEQLGDPEGERGGDQDQAGPVDRQHVEAEEGDRQAEDPERRREDQPGVPELDHEAEHAEREHQRDQVRVDQEVEQPPPEAHLHRRRSRRPPCAGRSPSGSSSGRRSGSAARADSARRRRSRSSAAPSRAGRFDATRTACAAQTAFRPCDAASATSDAAASLTTLRRRSLWMFVAAEVDRRRGADVRLRAPSRGCRPPGRSRRRRRRRAPRRATRRRSPAPWRRARP